MFKTLITTTLLLGAIFAGTIAATTDLGSRAVDGFVAWVESLFPRTPEDELRHGEKELRKALAHAESTLARLDNDESRMRETEAKLALRKRALQLAENTLAANESGALIRLPDGSEVRRTDAEAERQRLALEVPSLASAITKQWKLLQKARHGAVAVRDNAHTGLLKIEIALEIQQTMVVEESVRDSLDLIADITRSTNDILVQLDHAQGFGERGAFEAYAAETRPNGASVSSLVR